ncbi:MAG TPA: DUF58 domain-containing protein [Mycobacteriales bacterium]
MTGALHGLTARGRGFLAAGAAAAVSALVLGESDLLRVAILLAVLPLASAAAVALTRYRLACHRTLDPDRVQAGGTTQVRLRLENLSRVPTGVLLLEDEIPYTLGGRPRFVVERLWPRQSATVAYTVRAGARGRYRIGPLTVRLTDLFGLCEVTVPLATGTELVVTPAVRALPPVRIAGEWAGGGETRPRTPAVAGQDDAIPREYRHGDDLRRVHWRATARTGELMVRREEQPRQSRAVVLLDTRASAHHGESLEWAVAAVASLTLHLAHGGYALRLLTDTGGLPADGAVLDHLADVRVSRSHGGLAGAVRELRGPGSGGLVVAVLGTLDADDLARLGALRSSGATCVAVLLDVGSFGGATDAFTAGARAPADAFTAGARALARAGWHVLPARRDTDLAQLWPRAGSREASVGSS